MLRKKLSAAVTAFVCTAAMLSAMPMYTSVQAVELVDNQFEVTYDGWCGTDDTVQLTAIEGIGYAGSRGMSVSGRTSSDKGATSDKRFYLAGGIKYQYSVQVKSETAETFRMTLTYQEGEDGEVVTKTLDVKDAAAGEWTKLSANFKAPYNALDMRVSIVTDSTNDFVMDAFEVTTNQKVDPNTAYAAGGGLKDAYANYFRVGSVLNSGTVRNAGITANILKNFNSITFENEMKPDATMSKSNSSGNNIGVSLNSAASILDFCEKNGIGVRGHTLVWHSQTPQWAFKEGFNDGGAWVSSSAMDARMESYIKNLFAAVASQYPSLDLYAYDVANECVSDDSNRTANNGGARVPGYGNGASPWVQIYGSNAFVEKAFTYARKYAPENCKLFYNDYNEYWDHKRDCIYNMCKSLYQKGVLDGVGMQSHINADYNGFSGVQAYTTALKKYASIGCEVQITELDISRENGKFTDQQQADKYKALFQLAMEVDNVTAVCVWGPNDANTWIGSENAPLLFDSNNQPKTAYNTLLNLVPTSDWGDGDNVSTGVTTPEPDANGWFFHSTYEDNTDSWNGRGSATVATSGNAAYQGSKALYVTGREAAWNGATRTLNSRAFVPGEQFSFSANVCYTSGAATDTFYMKLQYVDANGETMYDSIAEGTAIQGEWMQLANTNYTIPAGATDLQLYIETAESTVSFYVDEAIGAVAGTKIEGAGQSNYRLGDVNCDGVVKIDDVVLGNRYVGEDTSISVTVSGQVNGDLDFDSTMTATDMSLLLQYLAKLISLEDLVPPVTDDPGNNDSGDDNNDDSNEVSFNYNSALSYREAPGNYLQPCSQSGTIITENYNGINGANKLKVYLPYGYDDSKQYNIFYLMHGGGENENTIFSDDVKLHYILDHMIMNKELEPMIVVTPTFNKCEAATFYKEFRQSVIPLVEGKYSTYAKSTSEADLIASRMHRAYGGFSMGALSTWCVGNHSLDMVGYLMPLSGDNWEGVGALTTEIDRLGLQKNQYFIMCATGSDDIAYGNMNPQMEAMKNDSHFVYTSDFSKGNFYYLVAPGKTHWWGYVRHYIYDALPYFFHEGQ